MRALVLSGGGSHGAYQVGALKYLMGGANKEYDLYTGISVGSINAMFLAQFKSGQGKQAAKQLEDFWLSINNSIVKSYHFPPFLSMLWKSGLYSQGKLRKIFEANIKPDQIASSDKLLRVSAVSLTTGNYNTWTERDSDIVEGVLASGSFPGLYDATYTKGQYWTDGGVRRYAPLKDAVDAGADEVDVVMTNRAGLDVANGKWTAPKVLLRSLGIMMDELAEDDLKLCQVRNHIEDYKQIQVRVCRPAKDFSNFSLNFDPAAIRQQIDQGYIDAKKMLG